MAKRESKARSLETRIHETYAALPNSERKLADLILEFPGEVAAYSATELSELAGVSKAAATRFFRRLGFASFEEARRLARDSRAWGSPLYLQSKSDPGSDPKADLQRYLDEEIAVLCATFDDLDGAALSQIVEKIRRAKRLWLVGFRNSHFLAGYARYQFIQFRQNVMLLPAAGETLAESVAGMSRDDLVIVIGVRRRVRELRAVMALIAKAGVPILYLTDPTARHTPGHATWTIRCHVASGFMFDSYVAAISVLRFLAIEAFRLSGKSARDHLKAVEHGHETLKAFE